MMRRMALECLSSGFARALLPLLDKIVHDLLEVQHLHPAMHDQDGDGDGGPDVVFGLGHVVPGEGVDARLLVSVILILQRDEADHQVADDDAVDGGRVTELADLNIITVLVGTLHDGKVAQPLLLELSEALDHLALEDLRVNVFGTGEDGESGGDVGDVGISEGPLQIVLHLTADQLLRLAHRRGADLVQSSVTSLGADHDKRTEGSHSCVTMSVGWYEMRLCYMRLTSELVIREGLDVLILRLIGEEDSRERIEAELPGFGEERLPAAHGEFEVDLDWIVGPAGLTHLASILLTLRDNLFNLERLQVRLIEILVGLNVGLVLRQALLIFR